MEKQLNLNRTLCKQTLKTMCVASDLGLPVYMFTYVPQKDTKLI